MRLKLLLGMPRFLRGTGFAEERGLQAVSNAVLLIEAKPLP